MSASKHRLSGYGAQLLNQLVSLQPCSIFAVEYNQRGSRTFVVSTHETFWKRYQAMLPQHRHCYEIIREGEPCHLYFGERLPGLTIDGLQQERTCSVSLDSLSHSSSWLLTCQAHFKLCGSDSTAASLLLHQYCCIDGPACACRSGVQQDIKQGLGWAAPDRHPTGPGSAAPQGGPQAAVHFFIESRCTHNKP